jgi:hypothetical protein
MDMKVDPKNTIITIGGEEVPFNSDELIKLKHELERSCAPLYIFDLDGTLADIEHRRPLLENKEDPHRWDKFYKECILDKPNTPVINVFKALIISGCDLLIFSGRSDIVRENTVFWILTNLGIPMSNWETSKMYIEKILYMRKDGDYTPDEILKKQWLDSLDEHDRKRLAGVFDDRNKVVKMWRDNGVPCFQVAEGDF